MKHAVKRAATTGGLVATGAFAFIYIAVGKLIENTGKPPRKPPKKN